MELWKKKFGCIFSNNLQILLRSLLINGIVAFLFFEYTSKRYKDYFYFSSKILFSYILIFFGIVRYEFKISSVILMVYSILIFYGHKNIVILNDHTITVQKLHTDVFFIILYFSLYSSLINYKLGSIF